MIHIIITFITILLIILLIIILFTVKSTDNFHKFKLMSPDKDYVDNDKIEYPEQVALYKYVKKDDVVLQLGGNIGTSCILVDKIVSNKSSQMCVEPNYKIGKILLKNKEEHNAKFMIIDGIITEKSGASMNMTDENTSIGARVYFNSDKHSDKVNTISLYNLPPFNVLFADCEGCLLQFLEEYHSFLSKIRLIIYERDVLDDDTYDKMEDKYIKKYGFIKKQDGFITVWEK